MLSILKNHSCLLAGDRKIFLFVSLFLLYKHMNCYNTVHVISTWIKYLILLRCLLRVYDFRSDIDQPFFSYGDVQPGLVLPVCHVSNKFAVPHLKSVLDCKHFINFLLTQMISSILFVKLMIIKRKRAAVFIARIWWYIS